MADSDTISGIENLKSAVSGETPAYQYKDPNTDMMKAISKCIDAADGTIDDHYEYKNPNTDIIKKMDELATAISEGGGGSSNFLEHLYSLSNTSRVVIKDNYYLAISKVENFTLDGLTLEQGSKTNSVYFFYDSNTYCIVGKATTDLLSNSSIEDASIGLVALAGPVDNYEWSTETASISANIDDIFLYISAYGTGNGNWVSSGADVIDVNDIIYSRISGRSAWLLKATATTITMRNAGVYLKLRTL